MAASMVGMVKMAEMAVILAEEGSDSSDRVRELELEKAALAAGSRKLKAALEQSEEMFSEQAELLAVEKENSGKVAEEREFSDRTGNAWRLTTSVWPKKSRI